jgi:hypothetical protein
VNGQRVAQPTRLHDGATVAIGGSRRFRQSKSTGAAPSAAVASEKLSSTSAGRRAGCSWRTLSIPPS